MKPKNKLQLVGSITLIATIALLITAFGGQFDFFGKNRDFDRKTPKKLQVKHDNNTPKYTFYNELKERKLEVDAGKETNKQTTKKTNQSVDQNNQYRYRVQVGAFKREKDALKVKEQLKELNLFGTIEKRGTRYLVKTKAVTGIAEAKKLEARLKKHRFPTLIKRT